MEKIITCFGAALVAASLAGSPVYAAESQSPPPSHRAKVTMGAPVSPEQQDAAKKARRDYADAKKKARADYKKAVSEAKEARKKALADAKAAHDKVIHEISQQKQ